MSATGFVLLIVAAVVQSGANLMLRGGIDAAGGFAPASAAELASGLFRLFLQPVFTIGFIGYFLAAVVWFRVIASEPLSVAYPILVGLTFGLVTAGALMIFHEPLSLRKLVGLAVILAGIAILSMEPGTA